MAESRARDGSDIADSSLVSKGSAMPVEIPGRKLLFHMLGVALSCLLGSCPMFVAGTRCEISSPYIDKPGILTPISIA